MSMIRCAIAVALLILSPSGGAFGANFLPNGSFEAGRYGWFAHSQLDGGTRLEIQTQDTHVGSRCAALIRTSALGNTWLCHDFIRLEKNTPLVFSVWLRADADNLPVTLSVFCFEAGTTGKVNESKKDITVGKQWCRYELPWNTIASVGDQYAVRIYLNAKGTLWVDAAQVRADASDDVQPFGPIELGLSHDQSAGVYNSGQRVTISALVANARAESGEFTLTATITDFEDRQIDRRECRVQVPAGTTVATPLDLTQERLGYFRVAVSLAERERQVADARYAFAEVAAPPAKPDPKLGICLERENIDTDIPLARLLGFGAVRMHNALLWGQFEKEQGRIDWSLEEPFIRVVHAAGLAPLAIADTVPFWAWNPQTSGPQDINTYGRMIEVMVRKWAPLIRDWEIINEPVVHYAPEIYFPMLKTAYQGAKKVDPHCNIVGVCGFFEDEKLMPYVFQNGGLNYMDVLSIHPYACFGRTPEAGMPRIWDGIRERMRRYGLERPIWSTEFGWRASDWQLGPDHEGSVKDLPNERVQAEYAVRSQILSFAHGVTRFYYFMLATHLYSNPYTNSLFAGDSLGSPRKSAAALAALNARLTGLEYTDTLNLGSDNGHAYRFADAQRQCVAMWAPQAATDAFFALTNRSVRIYDFQGNGVEPAFVDGLLLVRLTSSPIYLEASAGETITPRPLITVSSPAVLDPAQSRVLSARVQLANPLGQPIERQLCPSMPAGWRVEPVSTDLRLPPGGSAVVDFTITAPERFEDPLVGLRFDLESPESWNVTAVHGITYRIGPPPKPRHDIWIEAESASPRDPLFDVMKAEATYGGAFLHVETAMKPANPPGYLSAEMAFTVAQDGTYQVTMIGNPQNVPYISPMLWSIDAGPWTRAWGLPQSDAPWAPWPERKNDYKFFGLTALGKVPLQSGNHVLRLRIDEPRQADPCYTAFIDAFALTRE